MIKVNYLSNKELLIEIQKSKNTYSSFTKEEYSYPDAIAQSLEEITHEKIIEAFEKRAKDLNDKNKLLNKTLKKKPAEILPEIKIEDVDIYSLVFRVMTYDHIPLDPERKLKPKNVAEMHTKVNFPPYKHYVIKSFLIDVEGRYIDLEFEEVGRSHWIGSLSNGYFSCDHGKITNRLATMFIKLVDKYSQRGNWRGYCVDEETKALTKRGWLDIDQINDNDYILSYSEGNLIWSKIKSMYRGNFDGLMHRISNSNIDMLITPNHKLITENGLVEIEYINGYEKIILLGNEISDYNSNIYTTTLIELLSYIIHFGEWTKDQKSKNIKIHQIEKQEHIVELLKELNLNFIVDQDNKIILDEESSIIINNIIPDNTVSSDLIFALTSSQREILIQSYVNNQNLLNSTDDFFFEIENENKEYLVNLQILFLLSGFRSKILSNIQNNTFILNVFNQDQNQIEVKEIELKNSNRVFFGKDKTFNLLEPDVFYKGRVWCPETEYGSFVAKRNESVYLTGNTYLDEMKGQALLQLSMMGLQFDEGRSNNPFSYYTQAITNSFTRIFNVEKKNQVIRDDLYVMYGQTPSYTRQVENSIEQRKNSEEDKNIDATPKEQI